MDDFDPLDRRIALKDFVAAIEDVFWQCRSEAQEPDGVDFPSLYLFRHMIHMADAVEVLCSASAAVATPPLLRSMLEALFSLAYIHKQDYELRSRCWLCALLHQKIQLKELVDPTTEEGKDFQRMATEQLPDWHEPQTGSLTHLRESIENLRAELAKPCMLATDNEFNRLWDEAKARAKRPKAQAKAQYIPLPKWHRMFGGVRNLYEMADKIGLATMHKIYYNPLSATVHGIDPDPLVFLQDDESAEFRDLRDPHGLDFADKCVRTLLIMGTTKMLKKFVPVDEV